MVNDHSLCSTRFHLAAMEAGDLGKENSCLRSIFEEIRLLVKSAVNDIHHLRAASSNEFDNHNNSVNTIVAKFEDILSIFGGGGDHQEQVCVESPTSVMENVDLKIVSLPESIAVSSDGSAAAAATTSNSKAHPRTAAPLTPAVKLVVLITFFRSFELMQLKDYVRLMQQNDYVLGGKIEKESFEDGEQIRTSVDRSWSKKGVDLI